MRIKELNKIILCSCDDGQASKVTTKIFKVVVNVCYNLLLMIQYIMCANVIKQ